jgi:hypothetical protein
VYINPLPSLLQKLSLYTNPAYAGVLKNAYKRLDAGPPWSIKNRK